MRNLDSLRENLLLALERVAGDAAIARGAEEALWCVTRTLPSLLGDAAPATRPGALADAAVPAGAATAFMVTPDRKHHLITAPVNFRPEQHHELVAITLGHPGMVAATRRGIMLADTSHHESFVKILQTFRAGSAMQVPMLWQGEYLGVLICANAARGAFAEVDFRALHAFANLAAALWMAHDGQGWLRSLEYSELPVRTEGT
jgi:signal transduction protein with GAF and PtsI domain